MTTNTNNNASAATTAQYIGNVTEIKPLRACFSWSGTKHFYLVRVSNPQYKGSPWAIATLREDNSFEIDCSNFRTEKSAYKEFKEAGHETAYFLHEVPANVVCTLTY